MTDGKKQLGVLTMAYQDHFFVERWYRYWSAQIGAENLYLMSHGNDPAHREICKGATVLHIPRDPSMFKFDVRRWRSMGFIASGLLEFYRWMVVSDVDEIVVADPRVAASVPDWISQTLPEGRGTPRNIAPLCLELVHLPQEEPERIADDATILSRRRIFRPNWNYSKPCLIGAPGLFGPGGHRNNLGPRVLPNDLYTLHLKYFDRERLEDTADRRRRLVAEAEAAGSAIDSTHSWGHTLQSYHDIVARLTLAGEDIALPDFRAAMRKQRLKYQDQYIWGKAENAHLYRIPERFAGVF
ncbi:hypothetical protein MASR1M32_24410 [Rhodobacter sp.]